MKSVRVLSFFWAVFSRIRTKYGKTPNMDSIHAVALCRLDDIWKNTLEALILKAKLLEGLTSKLQTLENFVQNRTLKKISSQKIIHAVLILKIAIAKSNCSLSRPFTSKFNLL